MVNRRSVLTTAIAGAALAASPFAAQAQSRKDTMVLGMALEPAPGLDPTTGAAAAMTFPLQELTRLIAPDAAFNEHHNLEYEVGQRWEIDADPPREIHSQLPAR